MQKDILLSPKVKSYIESLMEKKATEIIEKALDRETNTRILSIVGGRENVKIQKEILAELKELKTETKKNSADIEYILENMATKKDLEGFATKKDLERFATKKDLDEFATKKDLEENNFKVAEQVINILLDKGIIKRK